jgi:hypothetical protein
MKLPYLPKPEAICAGIPPADSRPGNLPVPPAPYTPPCPYPVPVAYLLCSTFISSLILVVNPAKVRNNHRDWQGDDQDTTQGADGAKDLSCNCLRHHVSISERERERERGRERERERNRV